MKNILMIAFCMLTSVTYAQGTEIKFILPVKTSATQYILSQEIKPLLEKKGYKIEVVVSGNCIKAANDFKNSKVPTAMFIFNAYASLPECSENIPTEKNWVSNLTKSQIMICGKPGKDNLGIIRRKEKATIGSVDIYPSKIGKTLNPNFKYVPYSSSGSLSQGFLAGDTDFIITNILRATELVKNNRAECIISTGKDNLLGATAATKLFPDWEYSELYQLFSMIQKNMSEVESKKFQSDIREVLLSAEFKSFADKNGYFLDFNITPSQFNRSAKLWSRD